MTLATLPDTDHRYLTWPDGAFSYECRGCGACCKGLGIGVDAARGELDALAARYPEIEGFARLRGATWTVFNPRDRCWFLDDDGWCRVERDHGRDAKPASCRLFPFNRVFRVAGWLVVDYNAVICPLRAPLPESDDAAVGLSGRVSHASVLAEIAAIGDAGVVGTELPLAAGEDGAALLRAERALSERLFDSALAIRDLEASAIPGVIEELATQMAVRLAGEAELPPGAAPQALAEILDEPARLPEGETLRHALLATPSLRFNELFGRRLWHGRPRMRAALPGMWRTWLHLLAAGERLAGRSLTLQEVTSVFGEVAALGYLAAHWESPVSLPAGPLELPGAGEARERVLRFAQRCAANRVARQPLAELASPLLEGASVRERVATVRLLEGLMPRLELDPVTAAPATSRTARRRR